MAFHIYQTFKLFTCRNIGPSAVNKGLLSFLRGWMVHNEPQKYIFVQHSKSVPLNSTGNLWYYDYDE